MRGSVGFRSWPTAWQVSAVAGARWLVRALSFPLGLLFGSEGDDGSEQRRRFLAWEWPVPRYLARRRLGGETQLVPRFKIIVSGSGSLSLFIGSHCVATGLRGTSVERGSWVVVRLEGDDLPSRGVTVVGRREHRQFWFAGQPDHR